MVVGALAFVLAFAAQYQAGGLIVPKKVGPRAQVAIEQTRPARIGEMSDRRVQEIVAKEYPKLKSQPYATLSARRPYVDGRASLHLQRARVVSAVLNTVVLSHGAVEAGNGVIAHAEGVPHGEIVVFVFNGRAEAATTLRFYTDAGNMDVEVPAGEFHLPVACAASELTRAWMSVEKVTDMVQVGTVQVFRAQ